jgi:hypothetical protein
MSLISQAEWAKRQGFSKQYANTLIKNGQIPLINGFINEEQANAILASIRNPNQPIRRKQSVETKINAIYLIRTSVKSTGIDTKMDSLIESVKWKGYRISDRIFLRKF